MDTFPLLAGHRGKRISPSLPGILLSPSYNKSSIQQRTVYHVRRQNHRFLCSRSEA